MIYDARLQFSNAQAVTADAASTNVVDVGVAGRAIGPGQTMYWVVQVDVALDDASANETYVVNLEMDTAEGFPSATTLETMTFTRGDAAGTRQVKMVPISTENERYLRVGYDVGGTTPSGTFSSWLTSEEPESWKAYADAI